MRLRRGFKSEAHGIAREIRAELGLGTADPLDVRALAVWLDIPIFGISHLAFAAPEAVAHFRSVDIAAFSAVTVFRGARRTIWHNDGHAPGRQSSNIAHEISHGLLLHPPGPALGDDGAREWDGEAEAEASWLGGALLISDEAAFHIAATGMPREQAASQYGVSTRLLDFRLNVTAATLRVARARRLS